MGVWGAVYPEEAQRAEGKMWKLNEEGQAKWGSASIEDTAACEILIADVFPKPETEEEKRERMWKAVQAASQT